jgi:hypothetical protein
VYESFFRLGEEKKRRIVNAAIDEFALRGYDGASRQELPRRRNLQRSFVPLLQNQERSLGLPEQLLIETLRTGYYDLVNMEEQDIFERLQQNY